jgi:[acyl-carrier-protein] S-malonyltransferase
VTGALAALVGTGRLTVAQVDAAVTAMRTGPWGHALPLAGTPEGRNLSRWVVQILAGALLVEQEAAARRLTVPARRPGGLSMTEALESGGVAAAVLATSPAARAVRDAVTAGVRIPSSEVLSYYQRNLDRYRHPERRHLSRLTGQAAEPLGWFVRADLPAAVSAAVFAIPPGTSTGPAETPWGRWDLRVDQAQDGRVADFAEVRAAITAELTGLARTRSFAAWLAGCQAQAVQLMPGFEHPDDPRNPDRSHHH